MRATLTRQLDDVAESLRRNHAGPRPLTLQHRIGGERRAEHEELHVLPGEAVLVEDLGNTVQDALGRVCRRRRDLVIEPAAAFDLRGYDVGKRPARVDADTYRTHGSRLLGKHGAACPGSGD